MAIGGDFFLHQHRLTLVDDIVCQLWRGGYLCYEHGGQINMELRR